MTFTSLFRKKDSKEFQLELYDTPEKISMRLFYKILETNNLLLLAKNQERVKPENHEQLNAVWLDLLDFYYRSTNKQSWENFLRNLKATVKIKNEIVSCIAAFELFKLNDDRGLEYLKQFGVKSTNEEGINAAILAKETKLELAENKLIKKEQGEAFNMYRLMADLKVSHNLTVDIENTCLAEWVEILKRIAEKNRLDQEARNNNKNKRNGRNISSR